MNKSKFFQSTYVTNRRLHHLVNLKNTDVSSIFTFTKNVSFLSEYHAVWLTREKMKLIYIYDFTFDIHFEWSKKIQFY